MERFLKNSDRGKQVSWQQEFQDLPSAIGKLEVAESPALTEYEHVAGHLISDGDLLAGAGRNEVPNGETSRKGRIHGEGRLRKLMQGFLQGALPQGPAQDA